MTASPHAKAGQLGGLLTAHRLGPEGCRERARRAGQASARAWGNTPQAIEARMRHLRARREAVKTGALAAWTAEGERLRAKFANTGALRAERGGQS